MNKFSKIKFFLKHGVQNYHRLTNECVSNIFYESTVGLKFYFTFLNSNVSNDAIGVLIKTHETPFVGRLKSDSNEI